MTASAFLVNDFRAMAYGPLGVAIRAGRVTLRGFFDEADDENWRVGDWGRHQTRKDRHFVVTVATSDAPARGAVIAVNAVAYVVQDSRIEGDGVTTRLLVVPQ